MPEDLPAYHYRRSLVDREQQPDGPSSDQVVDLVPPRVLPHCGRPCSRSSNGPLPSTITFSLMPLVSMMRTFRCFMCASVMAGSWFPTLPLVKWDAVMVLAACREPVTGRQMAAQEIKLIGEEVL